MGPSRSGSAGKDGESQQCLFVFWCDFLSLHSDSSMASQGAESQTGSSPNKYFFRVSRQLPVSSPWYGPGAESQTGSSLKKRSGFRVIFLSCHSGMAQAPNLTETCATRNKRSAFRVLFSSLSSLWCSQGAEARTD